MQAILMKKEKLGMEVLKEDQPWETEPKGPPLPTVKSYSVIPKWVWIALVLGFLIFVAGLICIIIAATRSCSRKKPEKHPGSEICSFSEEAQRGKLPEFLKRVQSEYYTLNPNSVGFQPDVTQPEEHVKERYVVVRKWEQAERNVMPISHIPVLSMN